MKTRMMLLAAFVSVLAPVVVPTAAVAQGEGASTYEFSVPVFDIDATPRGSVLVAEGTLIKEIRRGEVGELVEVDSELPINGLASVGRGDFFATSAGSHYVDPETASKVWRVSAGGARIVADIGAFEQIHDPDAFQGPRWKDRRCEAAAGFRGPEENPYHLESLSGSEAVVADAAGNALYRAKSNGDLDWVALFTPPVDENGDWLVLFVDEEEDLTCYVQPVPTSVDIGSDGAYYVGELTGFPATPGLSRVWRLEDGARNVVCPSDDCQEVVSGLTSVIDVVFGPDGRLYVVEFDTNGWFEALEQGNPAGGTILACDVAAAPIDRSDCDKVAENLDFPSAITFDKWGDLWLLENDFFGGVARVSHTALP